MAVAILFTIAFALSLQAQSLDSPFAAAWLLPFLAACGVSLYEGDHFRDARKKGAVWYWGLVYLVAISISTFFIRPVPGAAATLWILAAAPLTMVCISKKHIRPSLIGCAGVLVLYAIGLLVQEALNVRYTDFEYHGRAWPIVNPNNAACLLNFGLIAAFWMTLRNNAYVIFVALFVAAIAVTKSRAGVLAGGIACLLLAAEYYGWRVILWSLPAFAAAIAFFQFGHTESAPIFQSFANRIPIWEASVKLLTWFGLGVGSFGYYYPYVRTESLTAGFYAHNDILQMWIEAGIIGAVAFLGFIVAVFITTRRSNIISGCIMLTVLLQASIEFQYYIPAISVLLGLVLCAHQKTKLPSCKCVRL